MAILVSIIGLLVGLLVGFTPYRTRILGSELQISSLLHTWRFSLTDVVRAEPAALSPWTTLRLGAVGRPFPPNGWLWSRTYGRFRALASSRRHLTMLTFHDGSHLLVSLPDPAAFATAGAPRSELTGQTTSIA